MSNSAYQATSAADLALTLQKNLNFLLNYVTKVTDAAPHRTG